MRRIMFLVILWGIIAGSVCAFNGDMGVGTDPNTNGSDDYPWLIEDFADFETFANNSAFWASGVHTKLTTDIDLDPNLPGRKTYTTAVIASNSSFSGVFNGNSFKVFNLTGSSLFGKIDGVDAVVKNLGIENISCTNGGGGLAAALSFGLIENCYTTGTIQGTSYYVGGLVGQSYNNAIILNCYNQCNVSKTGDSNWYIGGLVGKQGSGQIIRCYNEGMITGTGEVGGLVGEQDQDSEILQSYNLGTVIGTGQGYGFGGITGFQMSGIVKDCYNSGAIEGYQYVGGITGRGGYMQNCYNIGLISGNDHVGGLAGFDIGSINSFWDLETCGITGDGLRYGRTTEQMKQAATYLGWNDDGPVWVLDEGQDYPRLAWENTPGAYVTTHTLSEYLPGMGTEWDPYRISTAEQLNAIGHFPAEWDKVFFLENDIDAGSLDRYRRIGTGVTPFSGVFEGNGFTISNFIYITTENEWCVGLFGLTQNAVIQNLRLKNVIISSNDSGTGSIAGAMELGSLENCSSTGSVSGDDYVGGLVGAGNPTIYNCHSHCAVSGKAIVGGFIGIATGSINQCYSSGEIIGIGDNSEIVGGFAGRHFDGNIDECYSTGNVYGKSKVGGFVGAQEQGRDNYNETSPSISNCYTTGNIITDESSQYSGGFIGYQYMINGTASIFCCYSTGNILIGTDSSDTGGFIGYWDEAVVNCFWEIQTSEQSDSCGGKGRTTEEMKMSNNFIGWNNTGPIWVLDEGNDYPRLYWENKPGTPIHEYQLSDFIPLSSGKFRVSTSEQLNYIGLFPDEWDKSFLQVSDIDLLDISNIRFNKIGANDAMPFTGIYDGNGYTLSNLSYSTTASENHIGLFGYTSNAQLKRIRLENFTISSNGDCVGGLVGYQNNGTVSNCCSKGNISGRFRVGGLVGIQRAGSITQSYTIGKCSGKGSIGGLAGSCDYISSCYSTSDVYGESSVGGLVGSQSGGIHNCYCMGNVTGIDRVGGLVGSNPLDYISRCYSTGKVTCSSNTGGGIVGYQYAAHFSNCYWDTETAETSDGVGSEHPDPSEIVGKSTAAMKQKSTFSYWDFSDEDGDVADWMMLREGEDYPRLAWQEIYLGDIAGLYGADMVDFVYLANYWGLDCGTADCGRADIDGSGDVGLGDLAAIANDWLK